MSEENEKKSGKWFGWVKNIISAIAGAVISCAATIGIIGTDDAEIAKQKVDGWMDQTEIVYVQVVEVQETVQEAIQCVKDGKYIDAVSRLADIKDNATTAITTIKELQADISATAEVISTEVKGKVKDIKETVKEESQKVKEAIDAKPTNETPAPEAN